MKIKNFKGKIEVPSDNELTVEGRKVTIKGKVGSVSKIFQMPRFTLSKEQNNLIVSCKSYGIYDKRDYLTIEAHVKNMILGVKEGYTYTLKICSSHFPMTVTIADNKLQVKNLFGEKVPRVLKIKEGAKVAVKGDVIEVTGADLDRVSQIASEIELLTKISNRDRRVFQDGIYITKKAGKAV